MSNTPKPRGLAAMSPEDRRRVARLGGLAAQRLGTAHRWTKDEAQAAGKKGGGRPRSRPEGLCDDCGHIGPTTDSRCRPCHDAAMLLQARAILAGSGRPVTIDHLAALASIIVSQDAAIFELQHAVLASVMVGRAC